TIRKNSPTEAAAVRRVVGRGIHGGRQGCAVVHRSPEMAVGDFPGAWYALGRAYDWILERIFPRSEHEEQDNDPRKGWAVRFLFQGAGSGRADPGRPVGGPPGAREAAQDGSDLHGLSLDLRSA